MKRFVAAACAVLLFGFAFRESVAIADPDSPTQELDAQKVKKKPTPTPTPKPKRTKPKFYIGKVTVPADVPQGAGAFNLRVQLIGHPTFPVTLRYYPLQCPANPSGCIVGENGGEFDFLPLVATFPIPTQVLLFKNITACHLVNYDQNVFFDYAVQVEDVNHYKSQAVVKGFTCTATVTPTPTPTP